MEEGLEPEIPGPAGRIYRYDDHWIAVYTTDRGTAGMVRQIPDARIFTMGDQEWTYLVPATAIVQACLAIGAQRA